MIWNERCDEPIVGVELAGGPRQFRSRLGQMLCILQGHMRVFNRERCKLLGQAFRRVVVTVAKESACAAPGKGLLG